MTKKVAGPSKVFYGWWIVVASSTMTTYNAGVMFYGFTAFFSPILSEFGWTRAATSLAFSLQRLEGGIAAPIVGFFIDRFGPRKLSFFGVGVFGLGFLLLSQINSLAAFYATLFIISVGHSLGFYAVGAVTVANWFVRKRGKAMGFLTGGVCLAGIVVPGLVWLINQYGWRQASIVAGIGMWVIGFPLSFVLRHRPEQYGLLPDGDSPREDHPEHLVKTKADNAVNPESGVRPHTPPGTEIHFTVTEAMKTRNFWVLSVGTSVCFMAMSATFVHIMPFLESTGISRETAGIVVTFTIFLSGLGRIGFGWLSDYMDKRFAFAVAIGLMVIGLLFFANIRNLWHVILFVITFSPGYGASIPLRPAIQGEYFGRKHFGTIQGFFLLVGTVGAMSGPPFAGWICDVTGSYRLAFLILAGIVAVGIPFILSASPPRRGT